MPAILPIIGGAALPLATAYALGVIFFRRLPLPPIVRAGLGAVVESFLMFLLFLFGWGSPAVILAGSILCIVPPLFLRPPRLIEHPAEPLDRLSLWIFLPVLAGFGLYYLVHAAAPEIQPDAITYHLGLPSEYLRLGSFSSRVGFYEVLPQGVEMLFAAAFAFGRHSAAKLLHFSFLVATVPLLILITRRLKLPDRVGVAGAALYLAAPVVGISGTSAYTDGALVFYHLAAFYLLLVWRDDDRAAYAFAAGIAVGFCFAVKFTGLLAPPLALLFILVTRRRVRDASALLLGAALVIAPWMLRDFILTGNPIAPLFNHWFPNAFFNESTEQTLSQTVRTYGGFHWFSAPWDWAFGGRLQGVGGPLIFFLPIAVLSWRKPAARILLCAGLLLLIPVFYNVGTRFLMPALPLLAMCVVLVLPRTAVWALVAVQAIFCLPPVMAGISAPQSWMLNGLPWRASLRLQSEPDYLAATIEEYSVARMVEEQTKPTDRVFGLVTVAAAYVNRDVLGYWDSNRAAELTDALRIALVRPVMVRVEVDWPPASLKALRIVATSEWKRDWHVFDVQLHSLGGNVSPGSQWFAKAFPNVWESALAFDGNRTTYWSSRVPESRGMFLEVDFGRPQTVDSIDVLTERTKPVETFVVQGQIAGNEKWKLLADGLHTTIAGQEDLRREAIRALKKAGITHVLASDSGEGPGLIGSDMFRNPIAWGVVNTKTEGSVHLFRIL